jgi:hypothetical protein
MAKMELPAGRGTEAFDKVVKKITDSVRVQHEQSPSHAHKSTLLSREATSRPHKDQERK